MSSARPPFVGKPNPRFTIAEGQAFVHNIHVPFVLRGMGRADRIPRTQGPRMPDEADTCRRDVVPKLQKAGWDTDPRRLDEQVAFTDGRIVVAGRQAQRRCGKRALQI